MLSVIYLRVLSALGTILAALCSKFFDNKILIAFGLILLSVSGLSLGGINLQVSMNLIEQSETHNYKTNMCT